MKEQDFNKSITSKKSGVRNYKIGTMLLGSGIAAVLTAEYEDMDWMRDIAQTGIGRYRNQLDAAKEALDWSRAEEIPLEETVTKYLKENGIKI